MELITSITSVFTEVFGWLQTALTTVSSLFYSSTEGVTLFGILALMGLGISIFLLIVSIISNFFRFRG